MTGPTDGGPPGETRTAAERTVYEFGPFRLRAGDGALFREGERVRITPRVLDLLLCLVEDAGRIVSKEKLLERVWEGTFVEEGNVNRTVSTLRRVLEEAEESPYVETVPRQGYRFVAPVVLCFEEATALRPPEPSPPPAPGPTAGPSLPTLPSPGTDESSAALPEGDHAAAARPSRRVRVGFAFAALLAIALGATAAFLAWRHSRRDVPPRSLAVLPFRFDAEAANGETLAVALADAVITRLSRGHGLEVRPTTAVLRFRDGRTAPRDAGRSLGVEAVLDGLVSQERGRTSVTVRLIRTDREEVLLTETFRTGGGSLFELQDRVSERIASVLLVGLAPPGEARSDAARLAATELALRGRVLLARRAASTEEKEETIGLFRRAIEADPDFAPAYVGLADALLAASTAHAPEAEAAARRALGIDDRLGSAHCSLAWIRLLAEGDVAGADEATSRAFELEPSYAPAWQARALLRAIAGEPGEAGTAAERAVALDPTSAAILSDAGFVVLFAGRLEEARRLLEKALALEPRSEGAARLVEALADATDPAGARERALRGLAALGVDSSTPTASRSAAGDEYAIARRFAAAGRAENALEWLGGAVRAKRPDALFAHLDPAFRPLRGDARFAALFRPASPPLP